MDSDLVKGALHGFWIFVEYPAVQFPWNSKYKVADIPNFVQADDE
jgi:hypothetical protein